MKKNEVSPEKTSPASHKVYQIKPDNDESTLDKNSKSTKMEASPSKTNAHYIEMDECLSFIKVSQYQPWFDVLIEDDIREAESILNADMSPLHRLMLANSPFDYDVSRGFGLAESNLNRVTHPFHIATSFGSKQVAELLLNNNTNVLYQSDKGDNVLHSCVVTAFNRPIIEDEICDMIDWLEGHIDREIIVLMMNQENDEGFRPLEFASQQGCIKLMWKILSSRYYTTESVGGLGIYRLHNVTEYETSARRAKSPINMLAYLDKSKLDDPDVKIIIKGSIISNWITAKIRTNIPLVLFCLLTRILFIGAYLIVDADVSWLIRANRTDNLCPAISKLNMGLGANIFLMILLILACIASLGWDLYNVIIYLVKGDIRMKNLSGKKQLISNVFFYKVMHSLLVLLIFISTVIYLVNTFRNEPVHIVLTDIARGLVPVVSLWSICYYLQLTKLLGSFIITMQAMVANMFQFMLLFIAMLVPFVHAAENYSLTNSLDGCQKIFSNPAATSYTLYHIMLNIVDLSKLHMKNIGVLYMIEILYVFMVAIMLINFLIALMSTKASYIAQHRTVIVKIDQLALITSLEDQIFRPMSVFYRQCRKLGFYITNGSVYVKSCGNRFTELYIQRQKEREQRRKAIQNSELLKAIK